MDVYERLTPSMNDEEWLKKTTENLIDREKELAEYEGADRVVSSLEVRQYIDEHPLNLLQFKSGFPTIDRFVEGFEGGELIVISGPTKHGKTTLAQSLTKNFSQNDIRSLWFSYEMPVRQFLNKFRDDLPLFYLPKELKGRIIPWIEDRIWEAKLKYEAKVVFIDHLHFLVDLARMRNPSLEIGSVVRSLKTIAMRLNVVIFLIAHMTKTRLDHEPTIDDLRDCLPEDIWILNDVGQRIKIKNLHNPMVLPTMGFGKFKKAKIKKVWATGKKNIYQLITKTGRTIEASGRHKFLSHRGTFDRAWKSLRELKIGDRIAVPKYYPEVKLEQSDITSNMALLLGWLIGDGWIGEYATELTTNTFSEAELAKSIADSEFGLHAKIVKYPTKNAYRIYLSSGIKGKGTHSKNNKLKVWLKNISAIGFVGNQKRIPEIIFKQSNEIISAFLRGLFHADGSVSMNPHQYVVVTLNSVSRQLIYDVQHLLIRLGITSSIRKQSLKSSGFRTKNSEIYCLIIRNWDVIKFGKTVGFLLNKQEKMEQLLIGYKPKSRERKGFIYYDTIKSIKPIGKKETYDLEVKGTHIYCANDFFVHNSSFIGQDSDCVMTIHRLKKKGEEEFSDEAKLTIQTHRRTGVMGKSLTLKMVDGLFYETLDTI